MLEITEEVSKTEQSRDIGNIGHTRHRTNKRQRKPKGQSRMNTPETLTTLGTQDTGRRQKTKPKNTNVDGYGFKWFESYINKTSMKIIVFCL